MVSSKNVSFLIIFLFINSSILSCRACAKGQGGKGEKAPLIEEEKVLMEKIKKQVKPEVWKVMEQSIERNKQDKQAIDKETEEINKMLEIVGKVEKHGYHGINAGESSLLEEVINKTLQKGIYVTDPQVYFESNNPILKQYFADYLALYQYFKKQVELVK